MHAGDHFTVAVLVSSPQETLNAAGSIISFPAKLLSVDSVVNTPSILTLWVEQPTFSNALGTVSWTGVVPNPGFTGSTGHILSIGFTAKNTGTATLAFTSSSVLANDGSGTNILTAANPATVSISASTGRPPSSSQPTTETPKPQVIFVQQLQQETVPSAPSGLLSFWAVMPPWVQASILIFIGLATIVFALVILGFGVVVLAWLWSALWHGRYRLLGLLTLPAHAFRNAIFAAGRFFGMAERELKGDIDYSMHHLAGEIKKTSHPESFKQVCIGYFYLLRDVARRFLIRDSSKIQTPKIKTEIDVSTEQAPVDVLED